MSLAGFVDRPLGVAAALARGGCGGSYIEASMLVSGVISAVASYVWPGDKIDRVRFVEAWVRFADPAMGGLRISVPLLRQSLAAGDAECAESIHRARPEMFGPGHDDRVLTGDEVDATEEELAAICPGVSRAMVRAHSYPSLFYTHVRSAAVHEYQLGDKATAWAMTRQQANVSYENRMEKMPRGDGDPGWIHCPTTRLIHFHTEWMCSLAKSIAVGAEREHPEGNAPKPETWWLPPGGRSFS